MNKKILTVSLLTLLGVAGGAYTVMNTDLLDDSKLNISQYIPEPIAGLLGVEKPKVAPEVIDNTPNFVDENIEVQQVETGLNTPDTEQVVEAKQIEAEVELVVENEVIDKAMLEEVEKEIVTTNVEENSIKEQIQAANSAIYKLEIENKELEALFQKILRQNRSLAEQLRDLDDKIAAIN